MKVKHTKLKKSIFLILICISLTTTFVVSSSASDLDPIATLNYYIDGELVSLSFPIQYIRPGAGNQSISITYISDSVSGEGITIPADSSIVSLFAGPAPGYEDMTLYPDFPILVPGFISSIYFSSGSDSISLPLDYSIDESSSEMFGFSVLIFSQRFGGLLGDSYVVTLNNSSGSSDSSVSITDSVGSGLTSSLSWVGQVVESLTTGPIKPLLECFVVTISVSALLLGIYSIRRFIWGS